MSNEKPGRNILLSLGCSAGLTPGGVEMPTTYIYFHAAKAH
jgi:hypothetical protein